MAQGLQGLKIETNFSNVTAEFDQLINHINSALSKPFELNINISQTQKQIQEITESINNMGNKINQSTTNKPLINTESSQEGLKSLGKTIEQIKQELSSLGEVKIKETNYNQQTKQFENFIATVKQAEGVIEQFEGTRSALAGNTPLYSLTPKSSTDNTQAIENKQAQKENELVQRYLDEQDAKQQEIYDKANAEYDKKIQQEQEYQVLLERNAIIQEQSADKSAEKESQQQENQALQESLTLLKQIYKYEKDIDTAREQEKTDLVEELALQKEMAETKFGNTSSGLSEESLAEITQKANDYQNQLNRGIADQTSKEKLATEQAEKQLEIFQKLSDIKLQNLETDISKATAKGIDVSSIEEQITQLRELKSEMNSENFSEMQSKWNTELKQTQANLREITTEARNQHSVFGDLLHDAIEIGKWAISGGILFGVINSFKEGVQSAIELDSTLATLSITMNTTKSSLHELTTQMQQTAIATGSDITSVEDAVKTYANAGETAQTALAKSKAAIELSNVSGLDTKSVVDGIHGVISAYNLAGQDAEKTSQQISSSLVAIAKNTSLDFSTAIKDMTTGIQTVGTVASETGKMTYSQTESLIASIAEKSRKSGEEISNGLKTIISRVYQSKTIDESVTDEDLSKTSAMMKQLGVSVMDASGNYRNFNDILADVAKAESTMTDSQKEALNVQASGIRQANIFQVAVDSIGKTQEQVNNATKDSNALQDANNKYMDTATAKAKVLGATLETMWQNTIDSSLIKATLDGLIKLTSGISNVVNTFGLLPTIMGVVGVALTSLKSDWALFNVTINSTGQGQVGGLLVNSLKNISAQIDGVKARYETLMSIEKMEMATETESVGLRGTIVSGLKALTGGLDGVAVSEGIATAGAIALNAALTMGLSFAIMALISGISGYISNMDEAEKKQQELIQSSGDAANKYANETKSINDLIKQYQELNTSGNTDKDTKSQLLSIQNQLISSYGNEAKSLDLVNGKYDEQIKKIQQLSKEKADNYINSNQSGFINAQNALNKSGSTTVKTNDINMNTFGIKEVSVTDEGLTINGTLEQRVGILKEIEEKLKAMNDTTEKGQHDLSAVSDEYGKLNTELTNAKTTVEKMYDAQLNSKYSSQLTQMTTDAQKYQQALSSGDSNSAKKSYDDFEKLFNSMNKTLSTTPKLQSAFENFTNSLNINDNATSDNTKEQQANSQAIQNSAKSQEDYQKTLTDSTDKIKDYSKYIKDMNANTGHISSDDVKDIAKNHAELLPYLNDEKVLYQQIQKEIENEKATAQDTYAQMMSNSDEYYSANIKGTTKINDALKQYGINVTNEMQTELDNAKNLAEARFKLEQNLINDLSNAWANYYKTTANAAAQIAQSDSMTPWKISGDLDKLDQYPGYATYKSQAEALQNQYANMENAFNSVSANLKNSNVIDEMSDASEGLDKTSSAESAAKKANEQAIKDLEGKVKDLERQKKAYDDSVETAYKAEQQQEDAIKKGYQDQLDALKKKNDLQNQNNELLKDQNDLIEKQQDLENAQNEKNVRIYENGQWVWSADQQKVDSAQKALTEAQQTLSTKQNEIAEKAQEDALNALITASEARKSAYETNYQNNKDATDKNYDNQIDVLNQQKETLQGYASGTDNADGGIKQVAENGVELVIGSQLRNFNGGETVLNNDNTSKLFSILNGNGLSGILSNANLGFKMPNISIPNIDFSKLKSSSSTTNNTPITIQKIELPSVNNAQGFINELTQLVHTSM